MERVDFDRHFNYIVITSFCGNLTCCGCADMDEVYQALSEDLYLLLDADAEEDPDLVDHLGEEHESLMRIIHYNKIIKNPIILNFLFDNLYDDMYPMDYYVIKVSSGEIVFRYEYGS